MPRSAARFARILSILLALFALSACKMHKEDPLETLPLDAMYQEAKSALEKGNNSRAGKYYQRLVARFPYGPYTEQAQLELAYSQYRSNKTEDALSTINRFIRTYPAHQNIAYAYYLKALINFGMGESVITRIAGLDLTQRDQDTIRQSFNDFSELIRRYPHSRYAADARQRMVYLRNLMARHEINVALFYLDRRAYVAAANRAQFALENYAQSQHDGDAVAVMAEAYKQLSQTKLEQDSLRVLQLNYPNHPYLSGGWPGARSFWRRLLPGGENKRWTDSETASAPPAMAEPAVAAINSNPK